MADNNPVSISDRKGPRISDMLHSPLKHVD